MHWCFAVDHLSMKPVQYKFIIIIIIIIIIIFIIIYYFSPNHLLTPIYGRNHDGNIIANEK